MTNNEMNVMKQSTFLIQILSALLLTGLLVFSATSNAGPGHDHGDEAPVTTGEASPRVVMESELFEAVGIVNGRTLEIYIDHFETNAPVENATVELELNGSPVEVELHAEGEFDAELPEGLEEGPVAVAMTISAGEKVDILAGELQLHQHDEQANVEEIAPRLFMIALFVLGGFVVLALLVIGYIRLKSKGGK